MHNVPGFLYHFAQTAGAEPEGLAVLGLDLKAILLQSGTFLLLLFVIKKFALGKIITTLEQRRLTIQEGIDNAERMQKLSEESALEQEKILRKTHQEADVILAKAHEEAGSIVQLAHDKALEKTESMIADARAQISQDVDTAKSELKGELLSLVAGATEVVLEEKIDVQKDAALIERSLKELAR